MPPHDGQTLNTSLTWEHLRNRHPDYDGAYWSELRALLSGGRRLLRDTVVLGRIFPRHPHEEDDTYLERIKRIVYVPTAGEIVGDLVGMLGQDPITVACGEGEELDPFYTETFLDDVDRHGLTVTAYVQAMVREALTTRVSWALVDLPGVAPATTLAEEEESGALRAWVTPLPSEAVIDWEEDDDGHLRWACVHTTARRRATPGSRRDRVRDTFTFYSEEEWVQFVVEYEPDDPPKDKDIFVAAAQGKHSFGEVPLVRLTLPAGLWAMDKLYTMARAALNQRSALSYSQLKGLFPVLAAFLGPEMGSGGEVPAEAQQSPGRATEQKYGIGRIVVFGKGDALQYVSPDPGVYQFAAGDLDNLRDEQHRVTSTMAASIDNTPAAVGRSGESKAQDKSDRVLVLQAIGVIACDHVRDMLELVACGRKDEPRKWKVRGLRQFDEIGAAEAIEQGTMVEALTIPSRTFKVVHRTAMAKRIVARDASDEQIQAIEKEIDENTTEEEVAPPPPPMPKVPGAPLGGPDQGAAPNTPPAPPRQGPARAPAGPGTGAPPKRAPKAPQGPARGARKPPAKKAAK